MEEEMGMARETGRAHEMEIGRIEEDRLRWPITTPLTFLCNMEHRSNT
jgi:hypothetical protein